MAILKHSSIKNGDYGEAHCYLLFGHDPETQKPLRDEQGNMIMRKGYIQSGLKHASFSRKDHACPVSSKSGKYFCQKRKN